MLPHSCPSTSQPQWGGSPQLAGSISHTHGSHHFSSGPGSVPVGHCMALIFCSTTTLHPCSLLYSAWGSHHASHTLNTAACTHRLHGVQHQHNHITAATLFASRSHFIIIFSHIHVHQWHQHHSIHQLFQAVFSCINTSSYLSIIFSIFHHLLGVVIKHHHCIIQHTYYLAGQTSSIYTHYTR